jgi:hypothetical protein
VPQFSWSRGADNTDSCNEETKKEVGVGFVSRERQLARLRERMADGGVVVVSRIQKQEVNVPCWRCADRVVAP